MPDHGKMGRKSHHAQDAKYEQNFSRLEDDLGPTTEQPTRPTLGKHQANKSSKERPRNTK